MKIGLVDVDGHNFPNLALMKISAYHKAKGDQVEFADPLFGRYDKIYKSKVFTFTPDDAFDWGCEVECGGTGYRDYTKVLAPEVEHICPDYGLYGFDHAVGFLTRGCVNRCPWCVVPRKEGTIRPNADIEEFIGGKRSAVLLDNNGIASDWGLIQIEKIIRLGIRIDFNQGLDARIIARNPEIADLLARVKWIRHIRMAYDTAGVGDDVHKAIEMLRERGMKPYRLFFCVLIRDDIDDAYRRIKELRDLGCTPFAQPYRDFENLTEPSVEQKRLARWCNNKAVFHAVEFCDYK